MGLILDLILYWTEDCTNYPRVSELSRASHHPVIDCFQSCTKG